MITDITIRNADTNAELEGTVSAELLSKSMTEETGTGAVPAYLEAGTWHYVRPDMVAQHLATGQVSEVVTVYVESIVGCDVECGAGSAYDTGRIIEVDGDEVTVAWDGSGSRTVQPVEALCGPATEPREEVAS